MILIGSSAVKHMFDCQFLIDNGAHIIKELWYELYNYWNHYHTKNTRSDLKMTASEFFDNAITCEYSHDDLHTLLADPPTYTKVLQDGEEVLVSEDKFNTLTVDEKLDLVREEVMVMAYERFKHLDYRVAYGRMLKKFCLSHAPLWELVFIVENHRALHKPLVNYYKIVDEGLGKLKKRS